MLDAGIVRPSTSPWSSPPVLVRKQDDTLRYDCDFRLLNNVTVGNNYPIPVISDCLDYLQGNQVFTKLDAASGFWMIPMEEEDAPKTAFMTRYGLFEWTRMPFGLKNAPSTFSAAAHSLFEDLLNRIVVCYLDDIIIPSADITSHFLALQIVFWRLLRRNAKLKPSKCLFVQNRGNTIKCHDRLIFRNHEFLKLYLTNDADRRASSIFICKPNKVIAKFMRQ